MEKEGGSKDEGEGVGARIKKRKTKIENERKEIGSEGLKGRRKE